MTVFQQQQQIYKKKKGEDYIYELYSYLTYTYGFRNPILFFRLVIDFLSEETTKAKIAIFNFQNFNFVAKPSPQQHNGYDCGVFVCANMKLIAQYV